MLKKFIAFVLVAFMLLLPVTALADDQTIVEIAVENGSFTILVAALE